MKSAKSTTSMKSNTPLADNKEKEADTMGSDRVDHNDSRGNTKESVEAVDEDTEERE